jgi:hypothetical protein
MWDIGSAARPFGRSPPPPPDPAAGWERFAASRLEWDPQAAVEVDQLYISYARWCASHGEVALAEAPVLAWLQNKGATVYTGPLSQVTTVLGVRVTASPPPAATIARQGGTHPGPRGGGDRATWGDHLVRYIDRPSLALYTRARDRSRQGDKPRHNFVYLSAELSRPYRFIVTP